MKLLIVSYYDLIDQLDLAAKALQKADPRTEIYYFPALGNKNHADISKQIQQDQITHVLYWCFSIDPTILRYLRYRHADVIFSLFNWDEPHCWNDEYRQKVTGLDIAFTCCKETIKWYQELGVDGVFLLPGSPEFAFPKDQVYEDDISFCVTNLYEGDEYPNQIISRKLLIDQLEDYSNRADHKYKVGLYGPAWLKDRYPTIYKGWAQYKDLPDIFRRSKINLCTHVDGRFPYSNERSILIMGTGGLLAVDPIPGWSEMFGEDTCIVMDRLDPISTLLTTLENYDQFKDRAQRGYDIVSSQYQWSNWAETITHHLLTATRSH